MASGSQVLNTGVSKWSSSSLTSSPPKHADEKQEYVKPTGAGHEACGTGDDDNNGKKGKDNHGDGGGSGRGGRRGGKEKEEKIYCPECKHSFFFKDFVKHDCKKLQSSTIDG